METTNSSEIRRRSLQLEGPKMNFFRRIFCCQCFKRRQKTLFTCSADDMETLKETTDLTKGEINFLYKRFCIIGKHSKTFPPIYLRKRDFVMLGRMESNPLVSIFLADLFGERKRLSFLAFATYISTFKANTLKTKRETIERSKQKKMQLLFNMYDIDRDGIITQSDLLHIIHKLYGDIMRTETVLNVVQTILYEIDPTHGGHILFNNFCDSLNVFDMEEMLVIKIPEI